MPELAYLNGRILPIAEAMVSIEDRGYQFGDGVYEVIAAEKGKLFALNLHMERLANSMAGLSFPSIDPGGIEGAIQKLITAAKPDRASLYIQITRGVAPRNHLAPKAMVPQIIMTIRDHFPLPQEYRDRGVKAVFIKDLRWGRCDLKTTQLVANSMAKQEALDRGAYDALFVDDRGTIREATSSNVFIYRKGALLTHPLTPNILPGITRRVLIDLCPQLDLKVEETFFNKEDLLTADEVFLTGTLTEVLPVVEVEGRKIGTGQPGPVAAKLLKALHEKMV